MTGNSLSVNGLTATSTGSFGDITISDGLIVSSSGSISFDNENLITTGTITAANIISSGDLTMTNLTVSGTSSFGDLMDLNSNDITNVAAISTTTLTAASTVTVNGSLNANSGVTSDDTITTPSLLVNSDLSLQSGSITSASGTINFSDENLITTGDMTCKNLTVISGTNNLLNVYSTGDNTTVVDIGWNGAGTAGSLDTTTTIRLGTSYGDHQDYEHCVIERREYHANEQNELLLFSGNDPDEIAGPDRIRLRGGEIALDTYPVATTDRISENIRLIVKSDGNVGIGTETPSTKLEVNGVITSNGLNATSTGSFGDVTISDGSITSSSGQLDMNTNTMLNVKLVDNSTLFYDNTDNTKTMRFSLDSLSVGSNISVSFPSDNSTVNLLDTNSVQTLTNKTIDAGNNTITGLTSSDVGLGNVQNLKVNLSASVAPAASNDASQGYAIGSRWIDTTGNSEYVCVNDATGSAIWIETTSTGGGGTVQSASNIGTAGVGVFKQLNGTDLEFKKINAGSSNITITDDTGNDELDIDLASDVTLTSLTATSTGSFGNITISDGSIVSSSGAISFDDENVTTTGDMTANQFITSSDIRLKKNITLIDSPLEKVNNINGVMFEWNELYKSPHKDRKNMGVIADNVLKVVPEVVFSGDDGYKKVAYDKLVALLIEAVKEQDKKIEKLVEEVKFLKKNI